MPFNFILLPNFPGQNLSTMSNRGGKSGHPSLVTIKYNVSCGFFIDAVYEVEDVPFYFYFVACFYHERLLDCVKGFFCIC